MVDESGALRTMTRAVLLSCLLHLGLAGGFTLMPPWVGAARPPVLPVELVTLDAPVEPPRDPPPPPPPPRERIRPPRLVERPRLIEAPRPAEPSRAVEKPPAAPTPSPVIEEPAQPAPMAPARADSAQTSKREPAPAASPVVTVPSSAGDGLPAAPSPAVAIPPRREAAATEGVTRVARPQGGYQVRPSYPSEARRLGIQGTTLLRVHVLADGRIGDVVVERSAGHIDLDQSAAEAVRQWRFEPARRGTEPVAMWVLLPVEFRLR